MCNDDASEENIAPFLGNDDCAARMLVPTAYSPYSGLRRDPSRIVHSPLRKRQWSLAGAKTPAPSFSRRRRRPHHRCANSHSQFARIHPIRMVAPPIRRNPRRIHENSLPQKKLVALEVLQHHTNMMPIRPVDFARARAIFRFVHRHQQKPRFHRLDGIIEGYAFQQAAQFGKLTSIRGDRTSTRLNSSHDQTSYAVFGLNKKKRQRGRE